MVVLLEVRDSDLRHCTNSVTEPASARPSACSVVGDNTEGKIIMSGDKTLSAEVMKAARRRGLNGACDNCRLVATGSLFEGPWNRIVLSLVPSKCPPDDLFLRADLSSLQRSRQDEQHLKRTRARCARVETTMSIEEARQLVIRLDSLEDHVVDSLSVHECERYRMAMVLVAQGFFDAMTRPEPSRNSVEE